MEHEQKLPPGWSDFHGFGGAYYDYNLYSNGVPTWYGREAKDYSTDVIARKAVKSIRQAPRRKPLRRSAPVDTISTGSISVTKRRRPSPS